MEVRERMMDDMIRKYGYEHPMVIWFCELAEDERVDMLALENAQICVETVIESEVE